MIDQTIYKLVGAKPGKTVAIFGGVHGDERAGMMTIDHLREHLEVVKGTVYLVYANPRAMEQRVRYTEKNLNRSFRATSRDGDSYEERRAVELMEVLDSCDALLDLHAYNEPTGESTPFAICEEDCLDIVKNFDIGIVLSNIDKHEKGGSDGYMYNNGKVGICVELGAIESPEKFVNLGIKTAYQFLQFYEIVSAQVANDSRKQLKLRTTGIYKKKTKDFTFAKAFKTFDRIKQGEVVGNDGGEEIVAQNDQYILFPRAEHPVGVEVFLTAQKTEPQE